MNRNEIGNSFVRKRTWFGVQAVIEIKGRSLHRAGIGKWLIPHLPAVNWLLRAGLADKCYYVLSYAHEFGHFQVAPFVFIYALGIAIWILFQHSLNLMSAVAILVSIHATWEMLAEGYVRWQKKQFYAECYRGQAIVPRIVFWSLMTVLSLVGWCYLLW